MRVRGIIVVVVIGGIVWAWDSMRHDGHDEEHAAPEAVADVEYSLPGRWTGPESGTSGASVRSGTCRSGEQGDKGRAPDTHFRCTLTLTDGSQVTRVVHLVKDASSGRTALRMNGVG